MDADTETVTEEQPAAEPVTAEIVAAESLPDAIVSTPAKPPRNRLSIKNEVAALHAMALEQQCYELRLQGKSTTQIAKLLDVHIGTVYHHLERAVTMRMGDTTKTAQKFREKETAHLLRQRMELQVAIEKAQKTDLQAVAKLVEADTRISQRLAKLHGLDAAEKQQTLSVHMTYEQMQQMAAAAEGAEE